MAYVDSHCNYDCTVCSEHCPVRPARAIIVKSNREHVVIELPDEDEVKEVRVDDFGF